MPAFRPLVPRPRRAASAPLLAIVVLGLGAALACGPRTQGPREVAEAFWAAARAGDWEAARALSTAPDPRRVEGLVEDRELGELSFGEPLTGEGSALVPTFARREEAPTVAFNTHLARFGDAWRVDVETTERDLRRAAISSSLDQVGDSVRRGAQSLGEAMERSVREATEALERALEEMERELDPPPGP